MTSKELGNKIKNIRQKNDYTQEYVAFRMDMSIGAYFKLESGQTNQNIKHLTKLAEIYNVHVANFLVDEEYLSSLGIQKMDDLSEDIKRMIAAEREGEYEIPKKATGVKKMTTKN